MFILFPKENVAKVTIILFPTKFPMENYSLYFDFLLDSKLMGLYTDNAFTYKCLLKCFEIRCHFFFYLLMWFKWLPLTQISLVHNMYNSSIMVLFPNIFSFLSAFLCFCNLTVACYACVPKSKHSAR